MQGSIRQRMMSLWRGLGPTLAKDVPFAGLYWMLLEPIRTTFVPAVLTTLQTAQSPATALPVTPDPAPSTSGISSAAAALAPSPAAGPLAPSSNSGDLPGSLGASKDPDASTHAAPPRRQHSATSHNNPNGVAQMDPPQRPREGNALPPSSSGHLAMPVQDSPTQTALSAAMPTSRAGIAAVNAVSGAIAAGVGGGLTTPLDVVKTQAQTSKAQHGSMSTSRLLVKLWRAGGIRALFAGVGPRTIRTMTAYAILMSSYELCKSTYAQEHC